MSIHEAMAAVMKEITAIPKDKRNQQQGFQYRGIDDVYAALNPILARHGIFTTPEVLERYREERESRKGGALIYTSLRIRYTFWAPDGSSVSCVVEGEGMDSGDKSSNKAMAIAHKYALLQTFCVPTELDDPDAESHEVNRRKAAPKPDTNGRATPEQIKRLEELRDDPRSQQIIWPGSDDIKLTSYLVRAIKEGTTRTAAAKIIDWAEKEIDKLWGRIGDQR